MEANAAVPQRASMVLELGFEGRASELRAEEIAQRGPAAGQRGVRLDPSPFSSESCAMAMRRRGVQVRRHGEERVLSRGVRGRERGVQVGALDGGGAGQEVAGRPNAR